MKYFIFLMLALCACKIDRDKKVDRQKFDFKTGDDTEIFFKNMRQSYYDLEENKVAKFNVFRYEDRVKEADHPLLNLAIVVNYLQDEAYLLLESNQDIQTADSIEVLWTGNETTGGRIVLKNYNREEMLEFASQIYEAMQNHGQFELKIGSKSAPILQDKKEREAFRITISDFYRLTRIY